MGEENQKQEKLIQETVSFKFLFNLIISAPDCTKFKSDILPEPTTSIYSMKDQTLTQPVRTFINDLLDLPELAGGDMGEAFEKLFGKRPGMNQARMVGITDIK